eukprot:7171519-Lingulodinium_polyedra.AAC.1
MLTEEKGEYVRLDWADSAEPAPEPRIADRREAAAAAGCSADWRVCLELAAHRCPRRPSGAVPHINVLELRAIVLL